MPVLEVKNLSVQIPTEDGTIYAVQDVSFAVDAGELFGIVGESGSGKSVLVQAIMGLLPNARVSGEALLDGVDLLTLPPEAMRRLRGASVSMIFQDPLSSLHPQYTIGQQVVEQIRVHERTSRADAKRRAIEILNKVGIADAESKFGSYPHQFSGGMRQRVMIAMALVLNPALIIADEPTTALDSTVQTQILDLMDEMRREFNAAVLMISHDLGVLARVADRVMVMYAGRKMEFGANTEIFNRPAHPYAAGLLRSTPANFQPGERLVPIPGRPPSLLQLRAGCVFADRCPHVMDQCETEPPPLRRFADGGDAYCWLEDEPTQAVKSNATPRTSKPARSGEPVIRARGLELSFGSSGLRRRQSTQVLRGVDLTVYQGETLGLVGESGCGKSTLARVVAGLLPASSGSVELAGHDLHHLSHAQWRELRKEVQLVFQDPFGALNPRRRIGSIIGDPLRIHRVGSNEERKRRVKELMEVVGLNPEHYNRFPAEFSGGQRQRVGIARALALRPSVIIYDEPVSALDVSIQAQILNLMDDLQKEFGTTYLLISHDMSVVRHVSDRIAVMDSGEIVEIGTTDEIYRNPKHSLTKALLAASVTTPPSARAGSRELVAAGDAREEVHP